MPTAPKTFRPAGQPSKAAAAKHYNARRGSTTDRGYGGRWVAYRRWFLSFPCNAICGVCERAPAVVIDHVQAVSGPDDPLFWEASNHLAECRSCHSAKTIVCDRGYGMPRSAEGQRLLRRLIQAAARRAELMAANGGGYA